MKNKKIILKILFLGLIVVVSSIIGSLLTMFFYFSSLDKSGEPVNTNKQQEIFSTEIFEEEIVENKTENEIDDEVENKTEDDAENEVKGDVDEEEIQDTQDDVEEEVLLPKVELDLSHLSENSKRIVNEWQAVNLEEFSCDKLKNNELVFLFVPIQYENLDRDPEQQMNFELYSQYYMWAVNQEEPFSSYTKENKYYKYDNVGLPWYDVITKLKVDCHMVDANRPVLIFVNNSVGSKSGSARASLSNSFVQIDNLGYKSLIEHDKTAAINYHHEPPHELGHAFAGFLDEYDYSGKEERLWPVEGYDYYDDRGVKILLANFENPFNRGKKVPTCPSLSEAKEMWGDLVDSEMSLSEPSGYEIGYFAGCYNYSNRYKPTKRSMMATAPEFNLVQKRFLCELLIGKTGKNLGECNRF